ncbi:MAG TPA: hypothetical protein VN207_02940, partial [Ktedonobacteraceae bacterium]|nr:hypothetical protein [Ktedonobacteraceae bacterium]
MPKELRRSDVEKQPGQNDSCTNLANSLQRFRIKARREVEAYKLQNNGQIEMNEEKDKNIVNAFEDKLGQLNADEMLAWQMQFIESFGGLPNSGPDSGSGIASLQTNTQTDASPLTTIPIGDKEFDLVKAQERWMYQTDHPTDITVNMYSGGKYPLHDRIKEQAIGYMGRHNCSYEVAHGVVLDRLCYGDHEAYEAYKAYKQESMQIRKEKAERELRQAKLNDCKQNAEFERMVHEAGYTTDPRTYGQNLIDKVDRRSGSTRPPSRSGSTRPPS